MGEAFEKVEKTFREENEAIYPYKSQGKKHPTLTIRKSIEKVAKSFVEGGMTPSEVSSNLKGRFKDLIKAGKLSPESIDKALGPEFKNPNLKRDIKKGPKTSGTAASGNTNDSSQISAISGIVIISGAVGLSGSEVSGTVNDSSGVVTSFSVDLSGNISVGGTKNNRDATTAASGVEGSSGAAGNAVSGVENLVNNNSSSTVCNSSSNFDNQVASGYGELSSVEIKVISGTAVSAGGPTTSIGGYVAGSVGGVMINVNGVPQMIDPYRSGSIPSWQSFYTAPQPQTLALDLTGLIKTAGEIIVPLIAPCIPILEEAASKFLSPTQPTSGSYHSSSANSFWATCGLTNGSGHHKSGIFLSCIQD